MRWLLLPSGLEPRALLAFADAGRRELHALEGAEDGRRAWVRWLGVALTIEGR